MQEQFNRIIIFFSLILLSCGQQKKTLKLATYTYSTNDRIENMRPLSLELENQLHRDVIMTSYPDVQSFIKAIKSNEVDVALINTLGYLILAPDNKYMIPVANMHIEKDAIDNYKTVLLTNKDSISAPVDIVEKAQELTMMFVKEGSTSGNLVPRLFLSSLGLTSPESRFKEVKYGGTHTTTIEKLVRGKTDLCAIGSNEYHKQMLKDSTLRHSTRLIWTSEEIPLGPVLVNKSLSTEERDVISNALLELHTKNSDAFHSIKSGWSEAKQSDRFQRITDAYYNSFREVNGNRTDLNEILQLFE